MESSQVELRLTKQWREVMARYFKFMEGLVDFQKMVTDQHVDTDLLGPEMQWVFNLSLHVRKPVWVLEILESEHTRIGDLDHLNPREPVIDSVPEEHLDEEREELPTASQPSEAEAGSDRGLREELSLEGLLTE